MSKRRLNRLASASRKAAAIQADLIAFRDAERAELDPAGSFSEAREVDDLIDALDAAIDSLQKAQADIEEATAILYTRSY